MLEDEIKNKLYPNSSYLLAVSAGVDSMVMLSTCIKQAKSINIKLVVAHVNHNIRESAHRDEELVLNFCQKQNIKFLCEKLEACPEGVNFEAWARKKRYDFFSEQRELLKLDYILTAHNSNDVAETLLIKLVSNKEPRNILALDAKRKIIRPLLEISKEQIRAYAVKEKVPYFEDETNLDNSYLRNKIRNELIPFLTERFNPNIVNILNDRANAFTEDIELLNSLVIEYVKPLEVLEFASKEWLRELVKVINSAPEGLRWRMVQECFDLKLGFILGRKYSKALLSFILGGNIGIELPGGWQIKRKSGGLHIYKSDKIS
jgi:tRNA(Ile)-lysidine synthase